MTQDKTETAVGALREIARVSIPELNPDGVDQAAETMRYLAASALESLGVEVPVQRVSVAAAPAPGWQEGRAEGYEEAVDDVRVMIGYDELSAAPVSTPEGETRDLCDAMRAVMDAARIVRNDRGGSYIAGFDSHRLGDLIGALDAMGWRLVRFPVPGSSPEPETEGEDLTRARRALRQVIYRCQARPEQAHLASSVILDAMAGLDHSNAPPAPVSEGDTFGSSLAAALDRPGVADSMEFAARLSGRAPAGESETQTLARLLHEAYPEITPGLLRNLARSAGPSEVAGYRQVTAALRDLADDLEAPEEGREGDVAALARHADGIAEALYKRSNEYLSRDRMDEYNATKAAASYVELAFGTAALDAPAPTEKED